MVRRDESPLQELIAQQPFFKGLSTRQLATLAESALLMAFEPGQELLKEGGPANRFYLILAGKVAFEMEADANGATIPIQLLGPGDEVHFTLRTSHLTLHT